MAMTQFTGLTNKPYYGLNYENLVRARAMNLPAEYAYADEEKKRQQGLALQTEELGLQKSYYGSQASLSEKSSELAKKQQMSSNVLGLATTGTGLYGAYKSGKTVEGLQSAIDKLSANQAAPTVQGTVAPPIEQSGIAQTTPPVQPSAPPQIPVDVGPDVGAGVEAAPGVVATPTVPVVEAAPSVIESGTAMTAGEAANVGAGGLTAGESAGLATQSLWGEAAGLGMSSYTLPAMAGYYAGKYGPYREEVGSAMLLGMGGKKEKTTAGGAAAGAAAGAVVGTMIAPGIGSLVGTVVGAVAGALGANCIIVTACYGLDSAEVNITRQYRDKFLTITHLRGYYMLSEKVVPYMIKYPTVKKMIKFCLVNHLLLVGKYALNISDRRPNIVSRTIANKFLALCHYLGTMSTMFVRSNGEVV